MANSKKRVSATITGENQFTDAVELIGKFVLEIRATALSASTIITVQRTTQSDYDTGSPSWQDVTDDAGDAEQFTKTGQYIGEEPCRDIVYRAGVKAGDFDTATALVVELQQ